MPKNVGYGRTVPKKKQLKKMYKGGKKDDLFPMGKMPMMKGKKMMEY